jgi:hypothetical protein
VVVAPSSEAMTLIEVKRREPGSAKQRSARSYFMCRFEIAYSKRQVYKSLGLAMRKAMSGIGLR